MGRNPSVPLAGVQRGEQTRKTEISRCDIPGKNQLIRYRLCAGYLGDTTRQCQVEVATYPLLFNGVEVMDSSFGRGIAESVAAGLIILVIIVFVLGALTMWGLPKLWIILKPVIHTITA